MLSAWSDTKSYSEIREIGAQKFLFLAPISLLVTYFPISTELISKLLLFGGILIAGNGSYFAAKSIFRKFAALKYSNMAAIITSLFYMFNPWSMIRIVHFFHWLAYAFTPLIFLCFVRLLKNQKKIYIFLTPFLLTLISFSPHFLFYNLLSMTLYLILALIFDFKKRAFVIAARKIGISIFTFLVFLIFSAIWLIPYVFISFNDAKSLGPPYLLRQFDILEANKDISLINIITLNIHFTSKNFLGYFLSIIIIGSIILNFVLNRKIRIALFFNITAVIILLISSMNIFFPSIYYYVTIVLPFGWLFREVTKLGGLLAFSYAFIFGFLYLKIMSLSSSSIKTTPLSNLTYSGNLKVHQ